VNGVNKESKKVNGYLISPSRFALEATPIHGLHPDYPDEFIRVIRVFNPDYPGRWRAKRAEI